MNRNNKKAIERATVDLEFARILTASDPENALRELQTSKWLRLTQEFVTSAWISSAIDAQNGIFKVPASYASNDIELREVLVVQDHFRKYNEYATLLAGASETPFSYYLNGMTVAEFRERMQSLRGNDVAREIQRLYKEHIIVDDLGGSQLHRYMEQLGLKSVPSISKLNEAKRGVIPKGRYNMAKSRGNDEKYL